MRLGGAVGLVMLLGALALWLMGDAFAAVRVTGEAGEGPLAAPVPGSLTLGLAVGLALALGLARLSARAPH